MEPLEFGDRLMRRRARLEALAVWLIDDRQYAGAAVRQALADAWRARDRLVSEMEMDRFLRIRLRAGLRLRAGTSLHGCPGA